MKTHHIRNSIIAIIILAAIAAAFFLIPKKQAPEKLQHTKITIEGRSGNDAGAPSIPANAPTISVPPSALLSVPFTAQAPFGNWSDPNEEAGCEEASMIMAWHWIKGDINSGTIDQQQAENELQAMFSFEQQHYSNSIDTSAADTAQVFRDYYRYDKIAVLTDVTNDDIIAALAKGNVVLVPANGQALNNPHFKTPGPLTHMLLVKGYNDDKQQYITNDPGTKFGKDYIYDYSTLFNAIRDYPTGNHLQITGDKKDIIVISK